MPEPLPIKALPAVPPVWTVVINEVRSGAPWPVLTLYGAQDGSVTAAGQVNGPGLAFKPLQAGLVHVVGLLVKLDLSEALAEAIGQQGREE